jgi:hypothetical protein
MTIIFGYNAGPRSNRNRLNIHYIANGHITVACNNLAMRVAIRLANQLARNRSALTITTYVSASRLCIIASLKAYSHRIIRCM